MLLKKNGRRLKNVGHRAPRSPSNAFQFSHGSLNAAANAGASALATPYATPVVANALATFVSSLTSANAGFCITTIPSASPWHARAANAPLVVLAIANAAVAIACAAPLAHIARSNPRASPSRPHASDDTPLASGFVAVSAPATSAREASLASGRSARAAKYAVLNSAVVPAMESIENICTTAIVRQSSGVSSAGARANSKIRRRVME